MKKIKESELNYLASTTFYVASIMCLIDNNLSMGAVFLCLGTAFLFIGSSNKKKEQLEEKDNNKDKQ